MKRIKLIFKDGDSIEVDAEGFIGRECIDAVDDILDVLKPRLVERRLKPEYYKAVAKAAEYEVE